MNRNHTSALLIAAATLVATGAWASEPHGQPTVAENATEKAADKATKKVEKKVEKLADEAAKEVDKIGDKAAKTVEERAARRAKEHDAQREKLSTVWKGPVNDALRQELRRHAERIARLERIKAVAEMQKDKASAAKAMTLIAKENERHEKWLTKNATGTTPTMAPAEGKEGTR